MEKVVEILSSLKSNVDFNTVEGIVTNKVIDSIDIASLISMIEEEFDVEISMEYMENENFDSAAAIWEMVQELKDE